MLKSTIVSTPASKLILACLDIPSIRHATRNTTLVVGDVEREFFDLTDQHQIPVYAIPDQMEYKHNKFVKTVDLANDVNTYSIRSLFILNLEFLSVSENRYHLWRVLQEKAKVVIWIDSTQNINGETLADIGCDREPARISLADVDHPGNSLLYFQARRDASSFVSREQ